MITPAYVRTMAAYNAEMNRRWYAAADSLTDAQRREDRGAFFGSIHGTLCHLVWGDSTWMARFAGWPRPAVPQGDSPGMIADWEVLKATRFDLDARLIGWAGTVTQEWLDEDLAWFSGSIQKDLVMPKGLLVTHMFNHQTHHRGQAHAILTSFGAKTGDTDLPFVL
ncbi:MAG: DinB family protein [Alphaproteobacteria bacterium]|nr:DinB family protein [Alphaproteobacteria bacterium]